VRGVLDTGKTCCLTFSGGQGPNVSCRQGSRGREITASKPNMVEGRKEVGTVNEAKGCDPKLVSRLKWESSRKDIEGRGTRRKTGKNARGPRNGELWKRRAHYNAR